MQVFDVYYFLPVSVAQQPQNREAGQQTTYFAVRIGYAYDVQAHFLLQEQ